MNIYDLQISFGTEAPNEISLNIYFSGCKNNKKCDRSLCQNNKLHSFSAGYDYKLFLPKIEKMLKLDLISCICYLGGEPLDQNRNDLKDLTNSLRLINRNIKIFSYTGYDYEDNKDEINDFVKSFNIANIFVGHYSAIDNNQYWLIQGAE